MRNRALTIDIYFGPKKLIKPNFEMKNVLLIAFIVPDNKNSGSYTYGYPKLLKVLVYENICLRISDLLNDSEPRTLSTN